MLVTSSFSSEMKTAFNQAQKFQGTTPRVQQKRLSTFYTQPGAALLLAGLTIKSPKDVVLDPACGSGILLLAALSRKKNLLISPFSSDQRFIRLDELIGCEIDPLAVNFAQRNLESLKDPLDSTSPSIVTENVFNLPVSQVDAVLMNPPFTRQERLNEQDFEIVQKRLVELGYGQYFEPQMSLSAFFIFYADAFLRSGGKMGLVIPAATFSSRYSAHILQFLLDRKYSIKYLIEVLGENSAFSGDCHYKEYLLVLEKGSSPSNSVPIITLFTSPTIDSANSIADVIQNGKTDQDIIIGTLPQEQLFSLQNWESAFKYVANSRVFGILNTFPLVKFDEQPFAHIRSGFHGTYVDFLFLPNEKWNVLSADSRQVQVQSTQATMEGKLNISMKLLKKSFRKPENTQSLYTEPTHFILSIPPTARFDPRFQKRYLQSAQKDLQESMAVKKQRGGKETGFVPPLWYCHAFSNGAERSIGHLWTFEKTYPLNRANLSTFSREPVTAPNMFHLVYADDPNRLEALHSWFNTTFFFCEYLLHAKSIRRGWLKTTIGVFKQLRVPDLSSTFFTGEKIKKAQLAIQKFAEYSDAHLIPIADQIGTQARYDLDLTWTDIFDIPFHKRANIIHEIGECVRQLVALR